jgi:hypothetical protein
MLAARSLFPKYVYLRSLRGRRDKAKLLQHHQPIEHQIEREMLAVPKAEHLDVIHFDGAAGWRDVPHGTVEDAIVRPSLFASSSGWLSIDQRLEQVIEAFIGVVICIIERLDGLVVCSRLPIQFDSDTCALPIRWLHGQSLGESP